jgi:putative chitobiose transport system substrate-binding protein
MRTFKKIKQLALWGLFGLLLSWLVSCQSTPSNPTASGDKGGIQFWTMQLQPQFTPYFTELMGNFKTANPDITVKWEDVPWDAMQSKILTSISAKTAPDVVNLNPNFASQLAGKNAWLDLSSKVSPDIQKQYLPKIWQANTLNNLSFGIPWYLTTRVTIYNQDLLKKAGITAPPATYEELAKVAKTIKDKTGKYAFFITFSPGDSGEVLESMVQMGVKLVDEQGKAAFDTPEGLAAFKYWVDLYQQGLLPPEVLTQGHRHGVELYQSGSTALLSSGAEFLKTIEKNAPTIAKASAAAPQITGKTGKKNVAVMNLVIPRDSKQADEALKFALFVTNADNQLAFTQQGGTLPSNIEAIDRYIAKLEKESNNSSVEQARKVSAGQLKDAEVLIPPMKNFNQLQKLIYENLQAAMLKQKTVEQAVKDSAEAWNALQS